MAGKRQGFFYRVYDAVSSIPKGRVATYGQVALWLGTPRGDRAVGWALRALPRSLEARVPWHRVVGQGGRIAPRPGAALQRHRLAREGVRFRGGNVDLSRHSLRT